VFGCLSGIFILLRGLQSAVLLITLIGGVLLDIALAALLAEVALPVCIFLVGHGIAIDRSFSARAFGASIVGRDGR
jgi:hypothetical protein